MVAISNPSVFSIPSYSYSGKCLIRLHQTAFCTDSVFKKYFLVPLLAGCILPCLGVIDSGRWLFSTLSDRGHLTYDGSRLMYYIFFIQTVSHVLLVVTLPFRILSYFFGYSKALFSVDYTYRSCHKEQSAVESLLQLGMNAKFVKEALAIPLLETLETWPSADRIFYDIAWKYENIEMARASREKKDKFWGSKSWFSEPLALSIQAKDSALQDLILSNVDDLKALFDDCFQKIDSSSSEEIQDVYFEIAMSLVTSEKPGRQLFLNSFQAEDLLNFTLKRDIPKRLEELSVLSIEIRKICQKKILVLLDKLLSGKQDYKNIVQKALGDLAISVTVEKAKANSRDYMFDSSFGFNRKNKKLDEEIELIQSIFHALLMSNECSNYSNLIGLCVIGGGVDVNMRLSDGHTPLTKCALLQKADLVILLLSNGAEKKVVSNHPQYLGLSALQIAQKIGCGVVAALLTEETANEKQSSSSDSKESNDDFYSHFANNFHKKRFKGFFEEETANEKQSSSSDSKESNDDFYSHFANNFHKKRFKGFFEEEIPNGNQSSSSSASWGSRMPISDFDSLIPDSLFNISAKKVSPLSTILEKLKQAKERKDLWSIFEPIPSRNVKELEKVFKKLSLLIHPDKNLAERELATEIVKVVSSIKDHLISTL